MIGQGRLSSLRLLYKENDLLKIVDFRVMREFADRKARKMALQNIFSYAVDSPGIVFSFFSKISFKIV